MYEPEEFQRPSLDLGAGGGAFAKLLDCRFDMALDPDPERIGSLRSSNMHDHIVTASGEKMPLSDATFGTVVSNSVIEHVENPGVVLSEAWRVLRSGGSLWLTVPTPEKRARLHLSLIHI